MTILVTPTSTPTFPPGTLTYTPTGTATWTVTTTPTPYPSATPLPTTTPIFILVTPTSTPTYPPGTLTYTPTGTSTTTTTITDTPTNSPTITMTPATRLLLTWNNLPAIQTYLFNQANVTSLQFILKAFGPEPVSVTQMTFGLAGTLQSGEVAGGSVQLIPDTGATGDDAAGNGLYTGGGTALASGSFTSGTVVFSNASGLLEVAPGAPQTFLLVFSLNSAGGEDFYNSLAAGGILAAGAQTSLPVQILGGPINGNTHNILAPSPTFTGTPTATFTITETGTPTLSPTVTLVPTFTCPSGQYLCNGGVTAYCADFQTDPNNCGDCANYSR